MRLLDASYSLRRGPAISWQKCFHCSVFPGSIGKAIASDAIFLISFTCMLFQGKHFLPHVSIHHIPQFRYGMWCIQEESTMDHLETASWCWLLWPPRLP